MTTGGVPATTRVGAPRLPRPSGETTTVLLVLVTIAVWAVVATGLTHRGVFWRPLAPAMYVAVVGLLVLAVAVGRRHPVVGFLAVAGVTTVVTTVGSPSYLLIPPLAVASYVLYRDGRLRVLSRRAGDALAGLGILVAWTVAMTVLTHWGWRHLALAVYWWSGLLLALAVTLRRTHPRLGFWLVTVLTALVFRQGVVTYLQLLALAVATFSVIRSGRLGWVRAGVPAVLAAASLQLYGLLPPSLGFVWSWFEGVPALWVVLSRVWPGAGGTLVLVSDPSRLVQAEAVVIAAVALGVAFHRLDATRAELEDRNAALVALQRAESERAVTAERNRIARDLHDVVAHHVTAIVVRSQAAVHVDEPGLARETLGWIAGEGKEALAATRSLVQVLREDSGAMSTTTASLDAVLERTADRVTSSELAVRLELPPELDPLGQELETAIALIAQEALTNVALHSRADEAVVALTVERADRARLVVSDAGPAAGPGARRAGGNGLRHMTERAEALGGSLTAGPAGAGWRVVADLPVTTRRTP